MSSPPYTVSCVGEPGEHGIWIVQASIKYDGDPPPEGSELEAKARADLLLAIADVGIEGRKLGHVHVRMFLDEGRGTVTDITPGIVFSRHRVQ